MSIERLRALENKWRDELPYKGSAWEERHDIIEECADELASLIAELGQEVGAVAWIAPSSLESLNICRKDEHNGFVEVWMRPDEHRTIPLYTSPAHTSEARDAVMTGAGDSDDLPAFLEWVAGEVVRRDTRAGNFAEGLAQSLRGRAHILRIVKKDAAMRQEAE